MYEPYYFQVTGEANLYFDSNNDTSPSSYKYDPIEWLNFVESTPTGFVETISGSFYDVYGTRQMSGIPSTFSFRCAYRPTTAGDTDEIRLAIQSLRSTYLGKSGTFAARVTDTPAANKTCTARFQSIQTSQPFRSGKVGFVYVTFTFAQVTVFS